jgi:peptidoglycan hydrolase-like protein with peptidoglycan-binding domain
MQGEDIQLLNNELQTLGYDISPDEIEQSFFGPATQDAVRDFQRKHGLEPNGIVAERTAHTINTAVDAQRPIPEQLVVSGQVRHQDETPLEGLIVRAFDVNLRDEAQLGEETTTDAHGDYEKITKPSISLLSPNSNPRLKKS